MRPKFLFFLFIMSLSAMAQQPPLIPYPAKIEISSDKFILNRQSVICSPDTFEANFLQQAIFSQTGLRLPIVKKATANAIRLEVNANVDTGDESYRLDVAKNGVEITAPSATGVFYGIQTLLQLLPNKSVTSATISGMSISDRPKYKWRGMHLDVVRHFFPVSFVKKYIDYLAMYKMNTFHWHLTDDQGWRIEIKKYPKLTEIGGWRSGSMVGHYNDQKFDTIRYGGFYTQDEIKSVIAYAAERHITIIPEIEMPGHAVAALAAYPELSCTGGPFETEKRWGILEDVFCPKEETFAFLEDVLTEVMALFPSQYIHIGGDECPEIRWKNCAHCQQLIKDKKLGDEHGLQSYFITKIEKFINSKGRQIIGWDEILEGGLAPNAAVMSWRGIKGGIAAAKQKHYVVMSPGSHCYFDAYQGEPKYEPVAIGGYLPVEKVYAFNPTPESLTAEEAKYILGAQANLWTEYIATPEHVEYMIMPRMAALAEVVWGTSDPAKYDDFRNRLLRHFEVYEARNINYAKNIYELKASVAPLATKDGIAVSLASIDGQGIRYTTDGTTPSVQSALYEQPIKVTKPQTITAAYFENGVMKGNAVTRDFKFSKSTGRTITLTEQPSPSYNGGGSFTLIDGLFGDPKRYGQNWLGFNTSDLAATIDFSRPESISTIKINFLESPGSWIYFPKSVTIRDAQDKVLATLSDEQIRKQNGRIQTAIPTSEYSQLKITAENAGTIPDGKPGAGSKAWLFIDEISAE
jgi:hexosaminidase